MLLIMVLFTIYHFYIDVNNKINTGNSFAEGFTGENLKNGDTFTYKVMTGGRDFCGDGKATKQKCYGLENVCDDNGNIQMG